MAASSSTVDFQGKKLINDPKDVVVDFIKGLVGTYPRLKYLDGFPEVKVVLRADVSRAAYDKVAIISGGGGGHEPAHAGYVGEGMLTAAICGDVFVSPTVDSILTGIRAVTGSMGCLLIVKNYAGDCIHFGLAAEQAKSEGYKVETVIVGDDCALSPAQGIAGRRGLAGTILVHKVAGAAAAAGLSLADVAAEAKCASEMVGTMGVALSVCTLPGQVTSNRLGPGKMELGLGIHGEPGAAIADIQPVDVVVSNVLNQILSPEKNHVPITRGNRVVLMINGLGATPIMELTIVSGKAVPKLQLEHGLAVDRVYTGSFMTSLDMAGFSISIMKADEKILQRLDAATKAPYWPVGVVDIRIEEPPASNALSRKQALEDGLETMSSTMTFGLVLQTLSLLDTTSTSTRDRVCTLVAIATAQFAFVCTVISSVIKRRTNRRKLADFMLLAAIGLDILCVLFQAARLVPVSFMPVIYSAGLIVFAIAVMISYKNCKRQ